MRLVRQVGQHHRESGAASVVEMSLPAQAWLIPTVLLVVTDVASRGELARDVVADVRTAAGAACTALLARTERHELLSCRILLCPTRLVVRIGVPVRGRPVRPDLTGFDRRVLLSLVDELTVRGPGDDYDRLEIQFVKRRGPG